MDLSKCKIQVDLRGKNIFLCIETAEDLVLGQHADDFRKIMDFLELRRNGIFYETVDNKFYITAHPIMNITLLDAYYYSKLNKLMEMLNCDLVF